MSCILGCAVDVGHGDVRDDDAIGGNASRASVEVVLLDVDAIVRYIVKVEVLVCDAT